MFIIKYNYKANHTAMSSTGLKPNPSP